MLSANSNGEKYYNGAIDMMKFFAAMIIVMHHFQLCTGLSFGYINFNAENPFFCGANMVEVFFVISGYLSYKYTIKEMEIKDVSKFLRLKSKRLMPMVFGTTLVTIIVKGIYICVSGLVPFGKVSVWSFILGILPLNAGVICSTEDIPNETMWYISVLMLCYVVFFSIVAIAKKYTISVSKLIAAWWIIGMAVIGYSLQFPFLNNLTARGFVSFSTGILIQFFMNKLDVNKFDYYRKKCIVFLLLGGGIYIIAHHMFVNGKLSEASVIFFADRMYLLIGCIFTPALILVLSDKSIKRYTDNNFFRVLGEISFAFYIWHLPLIYIVKIILFLYPSVNKKYILIVLYLSVLCGCVLLDGIYKRVLKAIKNV